MRLCLLCVVATIGCAGRAVADIAPPPPPKGEKYVAVTHEVLLGSDIKGFTFVESVSGFGGGAAIKYRKLELSTTKPVAITQPGRRVGVVLFAVAERDVKKYKNDEALFKALGEQKIDDVHAIGFDATTSIKTTDKRDSVKWTHTITSINGKNGMSTKTVGDGYRDRKFPTDGPGETPTASQSKFWIAGVAFALAIAGAGLWFARRSRGRLI